jgi:hypothetical protein
VGDRSTASAGLDTMRRGASAQAVAPAAGRPGGWLDPGMVPAGIFRYGLTPESDLDIWVQGGQAADHRRGHARARCRA